MPPTHKTSISSWIMRRLRATFASFGPSPAGFVEPPEPRRIGHVERGHQLIAGTLTIAGRAIDFGKTQGMFWQNSMSNPAILQEIQGFEWLDDLAAVNNSDGQRLAQTLVWSWIRLYRGKRGPSWQANLVGRRVTRCIQHADFLLGGQDESASRLFFASLHHQTKYLRKCWTKTPDGLERFEALIGLLYGGLFLNAMDHIIKPAAKGLAFECASQIEGDGGIASRNANDLLEIFTLLTWIKQIFHQRNIPLPEDIKDALERIAPALRLLRQTDGNLPRFHGGVERDEGQLDKILAASNIRLRPKTSAVMGFVCYKARRTSLIIDAEKPAPEPERAHRHHRTNQINLLAFEMTSARQPIIISNPELDPAATHQLENAPTPISKYSTLSVEAPTDAQTHTLPLKAHHIAYASQRSKEVFSFLGQHDGFVSQYGLTHSRQIDFTLDGKWLFGQDAISVLSNKNSKCFAKHLAITPDRRVRFWIYFHIHPAIDVNYNTTRSGVKLRTKSGELWEAKFSGQNKISLSDGLLFSPKHSEPQTYKQIVLTSWIEDPKHIKKINWSFQKKPIVRAEA